MVTKKQINNVLEYNVKNYKVKNHKSDFTEFTYTTLSGRDETIHVIELTQKPTFIKKSQKQKIQILTRINGESKSIQKKYKHRNTRQNIQKIKRKPIQTKK